MTVKHFVDTNVLIYAASTRSKEKKKRLRAIELMSRDAFGLSGQILSEFYATVTRKGEPPMSAFEALRWIEVLEQHPCVPVDAGIVKRGAEISERYRISYWDGAVIAAAEAIGATTLYTEDLAHEQSYGSVRSINPFIEL